MNASQTSANPSQTAAYRRIVVPVSNPETAPALLRLATAFCDPEEGRVVAVFVSLESNQKKSETIAELQEIVDDLAEDQDREIELLVHPSTSIERGILDVAREQGAGLLIIGVKGGRSGNNGVGTIPRNVAEVAPCDVLVYRSAGKKPIKRVVVPADGSAHARIACQLALQLARQDDLEMVALYVRSHDVPQWQARARLEESLSGLPDANQAQRVIVTAGDVVQGFLARVDDDDLIMLGFSTRGVLERWLFGEFSRPLLNGATGPVVMIGGSSLSQNGLTRSISRRLNWVSPLLTDSEEEDLIWQAQEMAAPNLDYAVLALIAAVIASAGLLLNSAAVIIGAMLVAPLMQPLLAFAIGLTTGRVDLLRRGVVTLTVGVLIALIVGFVLGKIVAVDSPTAEMLARANPSLLDMTVAFAAGLIASFATARRDIPAALAGVAIAAALMPPLSTVGLALGLGDLDLALGAGLLFNVNIVCIVLAGWAVYFWLGMRPKLIDESRKRQHISYALITLIALPVVALLIHVSGREVTASTISERLSEAFPDATVSEVQLTDGDPLRVEAVLRSTEAVTPEQVAIVQDTLSSRIGQPVRLSLVVHQIITPPPDPDEQPPEEAAPGD